MHKELKHIDISNLPELLHIVEEVRDTAEPRILRRDDEDIAILMPLKVSTRGRPKQAKRETDYKAFRSAAGGWEDVDTEKLKADIYADRQLSDRPPADL